MPCKLLCLMINPTAVSPVHNSLTNRSLVSGLPLLKPKYAVVLGLLLGENHYSSLSPLLGSYSSVPMIPGYTMFPSLRYLFLTALFVSSDVPLYCIPPATPFEPTPVPQLSLATTFNCFTTCGSL